MGEGQLAMWLQSLVDNSLLKLLPYETVAPRFEMLETIREYAVDGSKRVVKRLLHIWHMRHTSSAWHGSNCSRPIAGEKQEEMLDIPRIKVWLTQTTTIGTIKVPLT